MKAEAMASSRCGPLGACVLLICAVATAVYTAFPVSVNPCTYSLPRALLAVSGLDPYIVSCAADEDAFTAPLSNGGNDDKNIGGPIVTNLLTCGKPKLPPHALPPFYCCPPMSASEPIDFTFPDPSEPLRVRRPAHAVGAEYMAKYERAIALMKALPDSDPRSFYQMANIHCAYCTGSYRQTAHRELNVQIHFSWFFFAFHRAYLYFFERIAAKLLGEPGFAVPFWSWDVPEGMRMPVEFANASSPLYDPVRNPRHAPPKVVDLEFVRSSVDDKFTDEQQIQQNLRVMYKQMISNAALPSLFHGQPYRAGESDRPGAGTVELFPHNTMHTWTGDLARPSVENMGVYYSAGRDPIFYPHHNNIDRLWEKEVQEEVLVIDGIETDGADMVKFDVYVNAVEYEKVEPGGREMAGSFVCLMHPSMDGTGKGMGIQTSMRVALNELLEDLGADGDDSVTVTLVPRNGKVSIGGLRIVYMME
ncbi:hypothetical protein BRADI_2g52260v3 [Brachypodium distachyon]|uniref:Tyrosinase copper-binding domain-containing protein n=1 Tax=Brachypodium distachyon TaxID=15368 RepID=A0A2K2DFF9_BRADI|nr:hypothetical protein BRADI_2g52260v3 [Brachypodium distachyon]